MVFSKYSVGVFPCVGSIPAMNRQNKEIDQDRPRLNFDQADALCRSFVPIGDALFDIMGQLEAAGFAAWRPRYEFVKSFGDPEDIEVHRRYLVEMAKIRLATPDPWRFSEAELTRVYSSSSAIFRQLKDTRDRLNGVPEDELSRRYGGAGAAWRRPLDPCERKQIFASIHDKETYDGLWHAMLDERRRWFEEEVERHATDLCRAYTFDKDGRYGLFTAVMERDAAAFGFRYDKPKARPYCPVFSKPVSEHWDLCWAIEEWKPFFSQFSPLEGRFVPYLELRGRNVRGRIGTAEMGEFLFIRFDHVVPGFSDAYWKFYGLDELETMIKARLCLYGLVAPVIEGELRKALTNPAAEIPFTPIP